MRQTNAGTSTPRRKVWQDQALCGSSPEADKAAFTGTFPTREIFKDLNKRYCSKCPVRLDCLNWAYGEFAFSGIAGGVAFVGEKANGRKRRTVSLANLEN